MIRFEVMDHSGHKDMQFTAEQKADAQAAFDKLVRSDKMLAFKVTGEGTHEKVTAFGEIGPKDKVVFSPQLIGG